MSFKLLNSNLTWRQEQLCEFRANNIAYPHRVYEGEAIFTPHTGRKHHNRL